ncbi:MAG TPA: aminotransferase class I/II-fold pyridoxal phosphate-dependent enzyme [Thermoanaerobaculia bacterium]|nr:aminotransferase class I/II-fold pyridoxal phosphate-dependent enzyme [Thermoanaerobaculia bacterium]
MKGTVEGRGFSTRAIHAGQAPEPTTGAVAVPIFQTSTYVHEALGASKGFDYARTTNPTRTALEENMASLEGGVRGHAFASGMAAITALLTLVRSDERVLFSANVYGGTYRLMTKVLDRYRIGCDWVDTSDLDRVEAALTEKTRLVFVETPTNPTMEITDIAAISELARRRGAKVAVDNTFMSPYFQNPLALGADVVVHSTTKFVNGHSDSIGGVLVSSSEEDAAWFAFVQKSAGGILSPFDSFLTLRGIKTLAVRMERHESNARAIAALLAAHPKVHSVLYPGLPASPGHEIQQRQARGFGGMIAFDVGSYERAKSLLDRVEVFSLAESLGGVESLISHPASMTHASVPPARQQELGIGPGLVRISVGIEDLDDLVGDLEAALG